MVAFGPISSRRLGLSLGINNIAGDKVCSYSCVYCQVGLTRRKTIQCSDFYPPDVLANQVKEYLDKLDETHKPDYLTFVANGEPSLDRNLGEEIRMLKIFGVPIAVITNASLLCIANVRENLMEADWVSVKVDTLDEFAWQRINRPALQLQLNRVLNGVEIFAEKYNRRLHTETMLVKGFNDLPNQIKLTASFIAGLKPGKAYLSIPTRPPAIKGIKPVSENQLTLAWKIFTDFGIKTELLTGFEGTDTGFTGNAYEDILNITAVHPIREETMKELIHKENADISVLDSLILKGLIKTTRFNGMDYYVRRHNL